MNPLAEKLHAYSIILGSGSPRRAELLKQLDVPFTVQTKDVDETPPPQFRLEDVSMYLARKKAHAFKAGLDAQTLVITADTLVVCDGQLLGKPADETGAERMLKQLSMKKHNVITGVCILTQHRSESFFVKTEVSFRALTQPEIDYYINTYKPFDKAGSYGIQEWIGMIGIEYIRGSYFNVMGLPTRELYENLMRF